MQFKRTAFLTGLADKENIAPDRVDHRAGIVAIHPAGFEPLTTLATVFFSA
jgi:hypothetical protein